MRTDVIVIGARGRSRRGWIAGDLDNLHPLATKALVHIGGDIAPVAIARLRRDDQPCLFPEHEPDQPNRPAHPDRQWRCWDSLSWC